MFVAFFDQLAFDLIGFGAGFLAPFFVLLELEIGFSIANELMFVDSLEVETIFSEEKSDFGKVVFAERGFSNERVARVGHEAVVAKLSLVDRERIFHG